MLTFIGSVAKYYSPIGVANLEPHMDTLIDKLCQELDSRYSDGPQSFDLGRWLL